MLEPVILTEQFSAIFLPLSLHFHRSSPGKPVFCSPQASSGLAEILWFSLPRKAANARRISRAPDALNNPKLQSAKDTFNKRHA